MTSQRARGIPRRPSQDLDFKPCPGTADRCPKCYGSGLWGPRANICTNCGGTGTINHTPNQRGEITRVRNFREWAEEHQRLLGAIKLFAFHNSFLFSLDQQVQLKRKLTDKQLQAAGKALADLYEERESRSKSMARPLPKTALQELFKTARESGLAKPRFVFPDLIIEESRKTPGTAYVRVKVTPPTVAADGSQWQYAGFIRGDRFKITPDAIKLVPNLGSRLKQLITSPVATATEFGHSTGQCVFCGKKLTDDGSGLSVERGYGKVCAERFRLPYGKPKTKVTTSHADNAPHNRTSKSRNTE